jgi:histidinol-phosphate aminotransferase
MKFINKYLRNLSPYKVASHKVWEVSTDERKNILKLDWNEASIPPSPKVMEALLDLVNDQETYYLYPSTYNAEIMDLLASYCQLPKENIQYFASSDSLHEYLIRTYVSPGDPILILGPTYDNFRLTCESQGGVVYFYDYNEDFSLNEEGLIQMIDSTSPSMIYLCNPNNPSGNLLSVSFIRQILDKCKDSVVLVDEAYYEFSKLTMAHYVLNYDNLFVSRTFSKAFALANFRAGYLLSNENNIQQVSKLRNAKNFTSFAQVAVKAALEDVDYMKNYVEEVLSARAYFKNELQTMPFIKNVFDSHGNFLLVEFSSFEVKMKLFNQLSNHNIFVRNLTHSKHLINCLRITVGTKSQMERVAKILHTSLI